ncbi:hypothetical protein BC835DRAFT_921881 [Cytidiella melzeri]|nr:hypothetical protein BC835DRAFT_921881 [Cytidiella melzeri]
MAHGDDTASAAAGSRSPSAASTAAATTTASASASTSRSGGGTHQFVDGGIIYGYRSWYIITGIIGAAVVINLFLIFWAWKSRHALRRQNPSASAVAEPARSRASGNGNVSVRRIPVAILTASRVVAFRRRISAVNGTLLEVFLTVGYLAVMLAFTFNNYGNARSIQKRAGELVVAQFPLIVGLAMKNNAVQLLTGISHEKLNYMHRTISRAALVLTWVHLWALVALNPNILSKTWRSVGLLAGIAQTLLTFLSFKPIRKRFYEFFFLGHVILVFTFLVASYIHVTGSNTRYAKYVWPCFLIWGIDRLCRYIRYLILSNFHAPNKVPAELELVSPDTIRITVRRQFYGHKLLLSPFEGGWTPGKHMFLAFPTIGPIESHPFTIANVAEISAPAVTSASLPTEKKVKENEFELMWIVRARTGFTRRLKEHILLKNKHKIEMGVTDVPLTCQLPIFMDGPYGAPPDITRFETCVFVAGGSGVAYTLPRMRDILNQVSAKNACARRVMFVWAIRHGVHITWIASGLKKAISTVPPGVELIVSIYVTAGCPEDPPELHRSTSIATTDEETDTPNSIDVPNLEDEKDSGAITPVKEEHSRTTSSHLDMKGVSIYDGRPKMHEILEDVVTTAGGAVSVDVSGPEPLVASIRVALSAPFAGPASVLRGMAPEVQLNVEEFTM